MRLQRDSYAPKSCAFDAANVQFLRAHLCKSHPVLQQQVSAVEAETVSEREKQASDENFRTGIFGTDRCHIAVPLLWGFVVSHGVIFVWDGSDYTGWVRAATEDFVVRENADPDLSRSG